MSTKTNVTISLDASLVTQLKAVATASEGSVSHYLERLVRAELARHAVRTLNAARPLPDDLREAAEDDWEHRVA